MSSINLPSTTAGVIFDLDGTLVSSSLDFEKMRVDVGCPVDMDILTFADSLATPALIKQAHETIIAHELLDAHGAKVITGVPAFLYRLTQHSIPVAIVTRNHRQAAKLKLANNQLDISLVLTREDAPPKPDPSALLAIAEQWKCQPAQLVYVGDYLYDIQAANNAGMLSVLYSPDKMPSYAERADIVFSSFHDLTIASEGSDTL